jgi:hypothetical protein
MTTHHYDNSHKGISYTIRRIKKQYHGYLNDIEYYFTSTDEDKNKVERRLINFKDEVK